MDNFKSRLRVGECQIQRSDDTKLLCVNIDSKQKWDAHFIGSSGLQGCAKFRNIFLNCAKCA